ncbi:MAG: zinc-binding alcohol dehydrogenase family protein [Streptosporangiaceae bacterium]
MKVVVTTGPGTMEVQEAVRPVPGEGQALIAVEAVGLCGSDFHLYDGRHPYAHFPQIQGHEFTGRIEAFGTGYDGPLVAGNRVAVEPLIACGHCFACRRGRYNCCVTLQVMGAHVAGGLCEFVAVPAGQLHPVGDMPTRVAVLVEPLTIGLQCVVRAGVARADTVVVIGAGPIGQAAALGAFDRGARVLVVDRVPSRLKLASHLGAEAVVNSGEEDVGDAIARFTEGDGAAVVIEATGVPALIREALDGAAHSGTVVIVGISDNEVTIPVGLFSRKEINILGSRNSTGLFPEAIALAATYADRVSALVTHTYPLTDTPEAIKYAMHHPHEVEKVIILAGGAQ